MGENMSWCYIHGIDCRARKTWSECTCGGVVKCAYSHRQCLSQLSTAGMYVTSCKHGVLHNPRHVCEFHFQSMYWNNAFAPIVFEMLRRNLGKDVANLIIEKAKCIDVKISDFIFQKKENGYNCGE